MGFMDQFKKITGYNGNTDNDYDGDDYSESVPSTVGFDDDFAAPSRAPIKSSKTLSIPATTHLQVIVVKPERYADAAAIADHFKNKKTVVLNLDNTNKDVANRLIDFLGGVAYAMDGELKRIANMTYIIVPVNVDISGDMIDELGSNADFI
ncbi:MAG: cell division protein SepF [Ruminiclostridium sp.]|nr:cell division protein SepF [Ruminiclostridium sp.]MBQ8410844.1 cell division protein SepF [Ruminiclostridium sp.]MBQ8842798.1 cell division protein SepF [Ruminiclostridium sp.]